jgi:hypothetical protein
MLHILAQGLFRWLEFLMLAVMICCSMWLTVYAVWMAPRL